MTELKIISVVKFNDGEAFVLNRELEMKYNMIGSAIVGKDGPMCSCLAYEYPSAGWKAFAGREFDIALEDGSVIKCNGQYWDSWTTAALKEVGENVSRVTIGTKESLKNCYVYSGCYGIPNEIAKLRAAYAGPVFDYWDYDKILKGRIRLSGLRKYRNERRKQLN